jgi:hypothetical protein
MAQILKVGGHNAGWQISDEEAAAIVALMNDEGTDLSQALTKATAAEPAARQVLNIDQAMLKAMRTVTAVGKAGYNKQQQYPFRGIDGVLDALGPALREAGVYVLPELLEIKLQDTRTTLDKPTREVTLKVKYTFMAEDGTSRSTIVPGESLDTSDKGTAKAMSVAYRIALIQIFALPTQEPTTDDDGQYHTRAGSRGMSKFEVTTCFGLLAVPTPEQRAAAGLEMLRASFVQALNVRVCLDEHDAWDRPSTDPDAPTWIDVFGARVLAEVDAIDTADDGRWLFERLQEAKMLTWHAPDGVSFADHMKRRRVELDARNAQALNTLTAQILNAKLEDLGQDSPVLESVAGAHQLGRITGEQAADLGRLIGERIERLMRERNDGQEHGHADVSD